MRCNMSVVQPGQTPVQASVSPSNCEISKSTDDNKITVKFEGRTYEVKIESPGAGQDTEKIRNTIFNLFQKSVKTQTAAFEQMLKDVSSSGGEAEIEIHKNLLSKPKTFTIYNPNKGTWHSSKGTWDSSEQSPKWTNTAGKVNDLTTRGVGQGDDARKPSGPVAFKVTSSSPSAPGTPLEQNQAPQPTSEAQNSWGPSIFERALNDLHDFTTSGAANATPTPENQPNPLQGAPVVPVAHPANSDASSTPPVIPEAIGNPPEAPGAPPVAPEAHPGSQPKVESTPPSTAGGVRNVDSSSKGPPPPWNDKSPRPTTPDNLSSSPEKTARKLAKKNAAEAAKPEHEIRESETFDDYQNRRAGFPKTTKSESETLAPQGHKPSSLQGPPPPFPTSLPRDSKASVQQKKEPPPEASDAPPLTTDDPKAPSGLSKESPSKKTNLGGLNSEEQDKITARRRAIEAEEEDDDDDLPVAPITSDAPAPKTPPPSGPPATPPSPSPNTPPDRPNLLVEIRKGAQLKKVNQNVDVAANAQNATDLNPKASQQSETPSLFPGLNPETRAHIQEKTDEKQAQKDLIDPEEWGV